MDPAPTLYHYTCNHGHRALVTGGLVKPPALFLADTRALDRGLGPHAALARLAWFTDQVQPDAEALGLTRRMTYCERTTYRWRVADGVKLRPIPYGVIRSRLASATRHALEVDAPGAEPAHWWVSSWPVPVIFAPADGLTAPF